MRLTETEHQRLLAQISREVRCHAVVEHSLARELARMPYIDSFDSIYMKYQEEREKRIREQMSDENLNAQIVHLLSWSSEKRHESDGEWGMLLDASMSEWTRRYPGTRPPAYADLPPPPACYRGPVVPIHYLDN